MGPYVVSSDSKHVDRELVWRFLHDEAYWSAGVPRDIVERAIDGSICFSAFDGDPDRGARQVAFARVVTDKATFAWLCDVFVVQEHRKKGVGKQLLDAVMSHPDLQGLRNVILATRDAHGLYARYGFVPLAEPARWMAIRRRIAARARAKRRARRIPIVRARSSVSSDVPTSRYPATQSSSQRNAGRVETKSQKAIERTFPRRAS